MQDAMVHRLLVIYPSEFMKHFDVLSVRGALGPLFNGCACPLSRLHHDCF